MVKFVAIYKQPEDKAAFDQHFDTIHLPLCDLVPNLLGLEVTRFSTSPRGEEPEMYLMAEMYFANKEKMMEGLMSEAGAATAKDARVFGKGIFSGHFAEVSKRTELAAV